MGAQSRGHLYNVPSNKLLKSRTTKCTTNWQHEGMVYLTIVAAMKGLKWGLL